VTPGGRDLLARVLRQRHGTALRVVTLDDGMRVEAYRPGRGTMVVITGDDGKPSPALEGLLDAYPRRRSRARRLALRAISMMARAYMYDEDLAQVIRDMRDGLE